MKLLKIYGLVSKAKKAFHKQDYPVALAYLRQALELAPQKADIHFLLGETYYYNKEYEPALAEFQWYKENWGEGSEVICYIGLVYLGLSKFELAEEYLCRALQAFAKFPEALYALGKIALFKGDEFKARRLFAQAADLDFEIVKNQLQAIQKADS
jgi:Tfp pilus assembly protein PilF